MIIPSSPANGAAVAAELLQTAIDRKASDIHLDPAADGCSIRLRIDGMLGPPNRLSISEGRAIVTQLMVMAQLLTYRPDEPQEGRLIFRTSHRDIECRVAVIPTTHGLRAAVRLPTGIQQSLCLDALSLPPAALAGLLQFAGADSGILLLCGPAGAGKTTTIYALLNHLARHHAQVSVMTLEDPIERDLPGVTQIQVSSHGGMTYERALRSVLRQDPQVLMLGEIRDAATASLAIQAALSGHRLVCTLHAASCGGAIGRLLEMGLEPYQITSTIRGVLSQRLIRRKVDSGYQGRLPVAEFVSMTLSLRESVLARADADELDEMARRESGHVSLRQSSEMLLHEGLTDGAELLRVLGELPEKDLR